MSRKEKNLIQVSSEIGTLRRLIVHSPDSGLGKVVPSKAQDWLFEDIVHLDTIRGKEYDYYTKVLLYFLDPQLIRGKLHIIDAPENRRNFYKPEKEEFFRSEKVVELEWLLAEILEDQQIRLKLVASVCAIEQCSYATQTKLLGLSPLQLAKVMISGTLGEQELLFLRSQPDLYARHRHCDQRLHFAEQAREKSAQPRSIIGKIYFFNHPLFSNTGIIF
jgi:Arginine deiminase